MGRDGKMLKTSSQDKTPLWVYNVLIYIGLVLVGIGLFPILGWFSVAFVTGIFLLVGSVIAVLASD
jgi:hypothetical protein